MEPINTNMCLRFRLNGRVVCANQPLYGSGDRTIRLHGLPPDVTSVERVEVVVVETRRGAVVRAVPLGISVALPEPSEADGGKKTFSRTVDLPGKGGSNSVRVEFRRSTKTPWRLATLYAAFDPERVKAGVSPVVDAFNKQSEQERAQADHDRRAHQLQLERGRALSDLEFLQRDAEDLQRQADERRAGLGAARQALEEIEREAAAVEAEAPRLDKDFADAVDAKRKLCERMLGGGGGAV